MKFSFSASNTKILRAQKHLAELTSEAESFLAKQPVKFDVKVDVTSGAPTTVFSMNFESAPVSIGAIVGDIIHNLRAALDLAACECVRANGHSDDNVYFPFCKSAAELEKMIVRRNFNRAGPDALALLRSLKPYHDGNADLRVIHDLDIHDKHRALIPGIMSFASPVLQLYEDDGTINPRVIGDPTKPTTMKLVFPAEVGLAGRELIPTLHELIVLVKGIVEAFRAIANKGTIYPDIK